MVSLPLSSPCARQRLFARPRPSSRSVAFLVPWYTEGLPPLKRRHRHSPPMSDIMAFARPRTLDLTCWAIATLKTSPPSVDSTVRKQASSRSILRPEHLQSASSSSLGTGAGPICSLRRHSGQTRMLGEAARARQAASCAKRFSTVRRVGGCRTRACRQSRGRATLHSVRARRPTHSFACLSPHVPPCLLASLLLPPSPPSHRVFLLFLLSLLHIYPSRLFLSYFPMLLTPPTSSLSVSAPASSNTQKPKLSPLHSGWHLRRSFGSHKGLAGKPSRIRHRHQRLDCGIRFRLPRSTLSRPSFALSGTSP